MSCMFKKLVRFFPKTFLKIAIFFFLRYLPPVQIIVLSVRPLRCKSSLISGREYQSRVSLLMSFCGLKVWQTKIRRRCQAIIEQRSIKKGITNLSFFISCGFEGSKSREAFWIRTILIPLDISLLPWSNLGCVVAFVWGFFSFKNIPLLSPFFHFRCQQM